MSRTGKIRKYMIEHEVGDKTAVALCYTVAAGVVLNIVVLFWALVL